MRPTWFCPGTALSRRRRNWPASAAARLANDWARTVGQGAHASLKDKKLCEDEARFQVQSAIAAGWFPACIGFEMPGSGELSATKAERLDCAAIIWDGCPIKAMKEIESGEECAGIRGGAVFLCLPQCSPGLNPIEQAWRIARRERTRNRFFRAQSLSLRRRRKEAFAAGHEPNEQLHRLCSSRKIILCV